MSEVGSRLVALLVAPSLSTGCSGSNPELPSDVGVSCTTPASCDDGVYCNGVEDCLPSGSNADGGVCVGGPPPCASGQVCEVTARRCVGDCTDPDADGDGHEDLSCGGGDCDDADANRFPGNPEVCDVADHDEDCDPATFGYRDVDGDLYPDATCCNVGAAGPRCGTDCNDAMPGIHPTQAELCNGVDDDCDGEVDEGAEVDCYADDDSDGDGDGVGGWRDGRPITDPSQTESFASVCNTSTRHIGFSPCVGADTLVPEWDTAAARNAADLVPALRIGWGAVTYTVRLDASTPGAGVPAGGGWTIYAYREGEGTSAVGTASVFAVAANRNGFAGSWRFRAGEADVVELYSLRVGLSEVLEDDGVVTGVDLEMGDLQETEFMRLVMVPDDPNTASTDETSVRVFAGASVGGLTEVASCSNASVVGSCAHTIDVGDTYVFGLSHATGAAGSSGGVFYGSALAVQVAEACPIAP